VYFPVALISSATHLLLLLVSLYFIFVNKL